MIDKLKEEWAQVAVWCVTILCMTILIGLGKAKPESMEMLLLYILGAVGRKVVGGEPKS